MPKADHVRRVTKVRHVKFQCSPAKVELALNAVTDGIAVAAASRTFKVPRTTLRNKISGEIQKGIQTFWIRFAFGRIQQTNKRNHEWEGKIKAAYLYNVWLELSKDAENSQPKELQEKEPDPNDVTDK
ncbi:hypothetical protein JTB14_033134 [Gonioctena quinquepunctata]|nr:hypothetical protein JTB14_033134 [Gonioctena quinquepunctata]